MQTTPQAEAFTRAELETLALFASADLDALEPVLRGCSVRELAPREVLIELGACQRSCHRKRHDTALAIGGTRSSCLTGLR
jgi:hypothetical protein